MGRYVYLGKKVPDIGEKGLDSVEECKGIADAILEDYENRRISYRTAMSRLNLLELVAEKNTKFTSYEAVQCREYVDEVREELMAMHEG
jgi:spore coat protein CotH